MRRWEVRGWEVWGWGVEFASLFHVKFATKVLLEGDGESLEVAEDRRVTV